MKTKYIVLSALLVVSVASAHGSLEDLIIKSDYQQFKQELQNQQLSESEKEALIALADDIIMSDRKNLELDWLKVYGIKSVIIPGVMLCLLDQMYRALRIDNIMRMESPALVEIIEPTRGEIICSFLSLVSVGFLLKGIFYDANKFYQDLHRKLEDAQKIKFLLLQK